MQKSVGGTRVIDLPTCHGIVRERSVPVPVTISVVICSYNSDRWEELVAAVRSCTLQTLPPDEIVVVIDHNDPLLRRATELNGVPSSLANQFAQGLSGARNTGVARSTG